MIYQRDSTFVVYRFQFELLHMDHFDLFTDHIIPYHIIPYHTCQQRDRIDMRNTNGDDGCNVSQINAAMIEGWIPLESAAIRFLASTTIQQRTNSKSMH
jgi:hypothetical protein